MGRAGAVICAHWARMGKWLQTSIEATQPSVTAHAVCEAEINPQDQWQERVSLLKAWYPAGGQG